MEGKVNNASLSTRAPGPPRHESEAEVGRSLLQEHAINLTTALSHDRLL